MVPSMVNEIYIIRFAVCAKHATDDDMRTAFGIIQEHADGVLAEHRSQRGGRQSLSSDSLDLAMRQNSSEHDTAVSEETVNPEALAETPVGPTAYPMTKARVGTCLRSFSNESLVSGQYDYNHHASPSCDVRQANIQPVERQTSTPNVRSYGFWCQTVFAETNHLSTLSSIIVSHSTWSQTNTERLEQSHCPFIKWTLSLAYSEHSRNRQFRWRRSRWQAVDDQWARIDMKIKTHRCSFLMLVNGLYGDLLVRDVCILIRECKIHVVSSVCPYLYLYMYVSIVSMFFECQWMSGTPVVSIHSLYLLDFEANKITDHFISVRSFFSISRLIKWLCSAGISYRHGSTWLRPLIICETKTKW